MCRQRSNRRELNKSVSALPVALCAILAFAGTSPGLAGENGNVADTSAEGIYISTEAGGPRRWEVTASEDVQFRKTAKGDATGIALDKGAILLNLGCEPIGGRIWCKVRPLKSRSTGYVLAKHLDPAAGPGGKVPVGIDNSRARAQKGDFDAGGTIACAQISGQPLGECSFGVARAGGGDATVAVTFSNGFRRLLFFTHGQFISADTTMSGTGRDTDWRVVDERHLIRVDDQRYELTQTNIFGD